MPKLNLKNVFLAQLLAALMWVNCALAIEFQEEDLAILDVVYQRQYLGNGLDVYLSESSYYIPLEDFIFAMELNFVVDDDRVEGVMPDGEVFILENLGDKWSISTGEYKGQILKSSDVVIADGLIYVEQQLITQWFGVDMQLEFSESMLNVDFMKPMPVQQRLARKNRKIDDQDFMSEASQPVLRQPYSLFEVPSIDARVSYTSVRNEDPRIDDYQSVLYSTRLIGDLLGMNSDILVSGTRDQGLVAGTARMERFDNSRSMLGILGLSQISIGDINSQNSGVSGSGYGRGILIGNDIVSGGLSRDIRNIEGDYYPGWEVELYLNNTLIGYQVTDDNGHYNFENVVLFEGVNRFLLKFYGPLGEREEQRRQIVVGDDPENSFPFRYSLSISQPGRTVFNVGDRDTGQSGDYRASLFGRYTVASNISMNFSLEELHTSAAEELMVPSDENSVDIADEDETKRFYGFGMLSYFNGVSISLGSVVEDKIRNVTTLGVGGNIKGTAFYLRTGQYNYEDSQQAYENGIDNIKSDYGIALNRRFNAFSFVFNGQLDKYNDYDNTKIDLGLSTRIGWVSWNNSFNYLDENSPDLEGVEPQLFGTSFFSTSYRFMDFRTGGVYTIEPESEFTNANLSVAFRMADNLNLDLSASHSLLTDETFYRLGMNWTAKGFKVVPSLSYNDRGRWQGLLQVSTSLGKRTGRLGTYYKPASNPAVTRGAVRARLFEDENGDGKYQDGEQLLSGGEISAVQARRKARSNKAGVAWLELMPSWERTDIAINSNTINEGYLALGLEPFSVVPRPGSVSEIDIPFLRVGEVDGDVEIIDGEHALPGVGVYLEITDSSGEVISKFRSDSSGYFNLAELKPGQYSLRPVDYELISVVPSTITIDSSGNFVEGVLVRVKPKYDGVEDERLFPSAEPIEASPQEQDHSSGISTEEKTMQTGSDFEGIVPVEITEDVEVDEPVSAQALQPAIPALIAVDGESKFNSPTDQLWVVQVGSFSNEVTADSIAKKIQEAGFNSDKEIAALTLGTFYRVFASGFIDEASAKDAKRELDKQFNVNSIVKKQ